MPYFDFSVTKKQTNTNHKKAKQYTIIMKIYHSQACS